MISRRLETSLNTASTATIGNDSTPIHAISSTPTSVVSNVDFKDSIQNFPFFWRLVVLGLAMLWASNFAVVKTILQEPGIDPAMYAAVRFSLAAIALLPQTVASFRNRDLATKGLLIGFCIFLAYVGQAIGLLSSTANKSAFICSMNVVWVAFVSSLLNRKFNIQIWVSVLLAVIGAGFMELQGSSPPVIGDLWLILQPIGFGTGYILLESLMKQYPEAAGAVSGFKLIAVALACVIWAIATGHNIDNLTAILSSPVAIVGLLYTGIITSACGVWIQAIAFKRVHATDASIILSSEPLWAAVVASILLGEHLSQADIIGGSFILMATISNEFNLVNSLIEKIARSTKKKIDDDATSGIDMNDRLLGEPLSKDHSADSV